MPIKLRLNDAVEAITSSRNTRAIRYKNVSVSNIPNNTQIKSELYQLKYITTAGKNKLMSIYTSVPTFRNLKPPNKPVIYFTSNPNVTN